jgi:hypothetical protein
LGSHFVRAQQKNKVKMKYFSRCCGASQQGIISANEGICSNCLQKSYFFPNESDISFRIWDNDLEDMIYDYFYINPFGKVYDSSFKQRNAILMQGTGIIDSDQNQIYEGDIIGSGNILYEVKKGFYKSLHDWEFGFYGLLLGKHIYVTTATVCFLVHTLQFKRLGNIYQTPELLKI